MKKISKIISVLLACCILATTVCVAANDLVYGDLNIDGKITIDDVFYLVKHISNYLSYPIEAETRNSLYCDFDRDKSVTLDDAIYLMKHITNSKDYPLILEDVDDIPTLTVASVEGTAGAEVAVTVTLKNNPGICAMRLAITYDSRLTLVSVQDEELINDYVFGKSLTANPYYLTWDDSLANENNTSNGTLVTLKFKVPDNAENGDYPISVSCQKGDIYNLDLTDIDFTTVSGKITVSKCNHSNKTYHTATTSTCIKQGNDAYYVCDDCGQIFAADGITKLDAIPLLPFAEHTGGTATTDKRAVCIVCGEEYGDYVEGSTEPTITVASVIGTAGSEVSVAVTLSNNPGICAARLAVTYDSRLTLVSAQDEGLINDCVFGKNLTANPYYLTWDDSLASENNTSNGKLVTLKFLIPESAEAGDYLITVSCQTGDIYDLDLNDINFATVAGKITVS